jgi:hypothetical protein
MIERESSFAKHRRTLRGEPAHRWAAEVRGSGDREAQMGSEDLVPNDNSLKFTESE